MERPNQNRRDRGADKKSMAPVLIILVIFLLVGAAILPHVPIFGLIWIVFCVYFAVAVLKSPAGKSARRQKPEEQARVRPAGPAPRPTGYERADRRVRSAGQEHDHIRSIELSPRRKLEQLETLKGAGLLTDEEYREKKREIMGRL